MESKGPFKAVTQYKKHCIVSEFDGKEIAQFKEQGDALRFARIVNEHDQREIRLHSEREQEEH